MLSLREVSVAYDGTTAVEDVSLELGDGEVLALLGPSGSGKSTLLRAVAGLEDAGGAIEWDGRSLRGVLTHKRGFALMFQDGQLFPHLTVAGNVAYPMRLRRMAAAVRTKKAGDLLELVGLGGYQDRLPGTLSGGERQRVALARALAVEPRLLLLDEPLSALDAGLRERLAGDLRRILHESGTTALMVTHDQEEAFAVADRIALLRDGRLVQEGTLRDVWATPTDAWAASFLGYARVLEGAAARTVLEAAGMTSADEVALRRSAFVADPSGPLTGTVVSARATPEQLRLVVRLPGVGEVDAVADEAPAPGENIALRVEPNRLAIPESALPESAAHPPPT
ncbi:thiamine transport system ATP-binding protein [Nocardioides albertanoniae]|uniref:ABC-type quaternary amine transporter n=1 Tax=Nocardioides albertanoniae TaxID=1175486 RepID=A0A543A1X0_9ACTN|nr:ABC transporter ATP-binding protein [Nocardioides albertanoniae]TQL66573.1 thiamine transport system ATP-binding protein [Nocardioides albertanoniae]